MTASIQDYAAIGDCRSAALVSKQGSIDWLCWPRFDSPSILGRLLDPRAGHWSLAPVASNWSERRYLPGTNVLATTFHASSGRLVVIDLMPVASEQEKRGLLTPEHEILRLARCESGEVELEMLLDVQPAYGLELPRLKDAGKLGLRIETSQGLLVLRADVALGRDPRGRPLAQTTLRAGESAHFSLTLAHDWPAVLPPLGEHSRLALSRSAAWWTRWVARMKYDGPARELVERSALALKLMVYAPSGAIIAAPTTSLPERLAANLNWDYRFCWLRDASLTIRALFGLGFSEEAETFLSWVLHTTRLTRPELQVLYDVYGNQPKPEKVLAHLDGHRDSRPVRIGNAATDQLQLDVYGDVVDAAAHFARRGGTFDRETQRLLCGFGQYVCRNWHRADEGIWEPRSGRQHHTHSRLLCWTALDRLVELHARGLLPRAPVDTFAATRDAIRREIETRAWDPQEQCYLGTLDRGELDASVLLMPWYGFENAATERMRLTHARIRDELGAGRSLVHRYRSEQATREGAFGICSFWAAEFLALGGGTLHEAEGAFEDVCSYANDVGLFAEEIDPSSGEALGNFPQAFTHVGLISAALSLTERRQRDEVARPRATTPSEPTTRARP